MTIGERIKKRRLELNLSADTLANKLGKDRATIYRYESNSIKNFPISILEPLAEALQTTPAYFISSDEDNQKLFEEQADHILDNVFGNLGYNAYKLLKIYFSLPDNASSILLEQADFLAHKNNIIDTIPSEDDLMNNL